MRCTTRIKFDGARFCITNYADANQLYVPSLPFAITIIGIERLDNNEDLHISLVAQVNHHPAEIPRSCNCFLQ